MSLIEKYEVITLLINEVENDIKKIFILISQLQSNNNTNFYEDFKKFITKMFEICYKKCNLKLNYNLFNN